MVKSPSEDAFVYFISAPGPGLIKIGYSASSPDQRLASLQCASPVPLKRLGLIGGSRTFEQLLHIRFGAIRSHLEWFRATPELTGYVKDYAWRWTRPVSSFVGASGVPVRCYEREVARADPWFGRAITQCVRNVPGYEVFDPRHAPRCLSLFAGFLPTAGEVKRAVEFDRRFANLGAD